MQKTAPKHQNQTKGTHGAHDAIPNTKKKNSQATNRRPKTENKKKINERKKRKTATHKWARM